MLRVFKTNIAVGASALMTACGGGGGGGAPVVSNPTAYLCSAPLVVNSTNDGCINAFTLTDLVKSNSITLDYGKYGAPVNTEFLYRSGLLVDLNGDGVNEFIFSVTPYPQIAVPLSVVGDSNGNIDLSIKYFPNGAPYVKHAPYIYYEDINNDGKKDIISSDAGLDIPPWTGSKIGVAFKSGDYFINSSNLIPDTTNRNYFLAIGDFLGKKRKDILISNQDSSGVGSPSVFNLNNSLLTITQNPFPDWIKNYLYRATV